MYSNEDKVIKCTSPFNVHLDWYPSIPTATLELLSRRTICFDLIERSLCNCFSVLEFGSIDDTHAQEYIICINNGRLGVISSRVWFLTAAEKYSGVCSICRKGGCSWTSSPGTKGDGYQPLLEKVWLVQLYGRLLLSLSDNSQRCCWFCCCRWGWSTRAHYSWLCNLRFFLPTPMRCSFLSGLGSCVLSWI